MPLGSLDLIGKRVTRGAHFVRPDALFLGESVRGVSSSLMGSGRVVMQGELLE